jgi:hypothetical protein
MYETERKPLLECEMEIIGLTHPDLSAEALAYWNLPDAIHDAVRHHHTPDLDRSPEHPGETKLSRVLDAANQYVNSIGVSILKVCPDGADGTVVGTLGLPADVLETVLAEFKTEHEAMSSFFR